MGNGNTNVLTGNEITGFNSRNGNDLQGKIYTSAVTPNVPTPYQLHSNKAYIVKDEKT